MKPKIRNFGVLFAILVMSIIGIGVTANAAEEPCTGNGPDDQMVRVGALCVDKYEASVWSNSDGVGVQYGADKHDYPDGFPDTGNWTQKLYAVSKAGVTPSRFITWFQAQQACALSRKRLLSNAEWQMAAAGTPDPKKDDGKTSCATGNNLAPTGARSDCVSKWGINDMVGNVSEWVATWTQSGNDVWQPTGHATKDTTNDLYGNDIMAEVQATHRQGAGRNFPAAWIRGGSFRSFTGAGVFAIDTSHAPSDNDLLTGHIGFRCARE